MSGDGGALVKGSHMIATDAEDGSTSIMVTHPAAGEWKIEPHAGSAEITGVDRAYAEPAPTISGGVGGKGHKRFLAYAFAPNPGQTITFVERGKRTTQVLGTARAGKCKAAPRGERSVACGRLKFTPGRGGKGKRQILAVVEQDGRPREEIELATYAAPKDRLPAAPRLLRARRSGTDVHVRWASVPGAAGYTASVTLSDGRKLGFAPKGQRLRVRGVGRDTTVRVTLRALRDDAKVGKPAKVTVKATRRANLAPAEAKPRKINNKKKGGRR
jgi:hypothetical protein